MNNQHGFSRLRDTDEKCGVIGAIGSRLAAVYCRVGIEDLQHRGSDSAGIGQGRLFYGGIGKVRKALPSVSKIKRRLKGISAIAHTRYATTGDQRVGNFQPMQMKVRVKVKGKGTVKVLWLCHNGNVPDVSSLTVGLPEAPSGFTATSDTGVLIRRIAANLSAGLSFEESLILGLKNVLGAFSLIVLWDNQMAAIRDPRGMRPLVISKFNHVTVAASESCAIDAIARRFKIKPEMVTEVRPGEIVIADSNSNLRSVWLEPSRHFLCFLERVYFGMPTSIIGGRSISVIREELGQQLAKEFPAIKFDMVAPVPDSGIPFALGFTWESGSRFQQALLRSHNYERSFIKKTDADRIRAVRAKLVVDANLVRGKRVLLIDDSLIRGITMREIIRMLKDAGAIEVHVLIASPPFLSPCFYGVSIPKYGDLIAFKRSIEEIRKSIEADSLNFLSFAGLKAVLGDEGNCFACITNEYPPELGLPPDFVHIQHNGGRLS
jgi:amidophosphoribosyltransferase